jgi:hypothetical protein
VFQPHGPVEGLFCLFFGHPIVDRHDECWVAGLEKYGNRIQSGCL